MNAFTLKTPTIRVPGLLTDEALQEQLKLQKQNFNGGASQAPTGALEMADRVQSEFFDAPVRKTLRAMAPLAGPFNPALQLASSVTLPDMSATQSGPQVDPQQRAVEVRSDILSNDTMSGPMSYAIGGPLGFAVREGGALAELGTLTPEQSEQERQRREVAAGEREVVVKSMVETRQKLRNLTQEEATAMGLPIQPGIDAETEREQRQIQEQLDVDRVKRAEERTVDAKVTAPKTTWWLNSIRSYYGGLNSMFTGIGKGATIGLWELPGELTGIRDEGRSDMRAWFDTVDQTMNKVLPTDVAQAEDFATKLSQGAGSMVGFMVAGLIAHQIGLPANASTMIVGASSGASQQYEDAERFGAGGVQRLMSFMAGAGLGMTEAIPINRALMRLETATGGAVSRGLQSTATASLQEFIQELGQNLGQDVVAKAIYDEQRALDWKGYLEAGAVGGILGALGGGAAETLGRSGFGRQPQTAEQATSAEVPSVEEQTAFLTGFMDRTQKAFDQITAEPVTADAPLGVAKPQTAAAQQLNDGAASVRDTVPVAVGPDNSFSGEVVVRHGFEGDAVPSFVKDFEGRRYSGNSFGDTGVYLDNNGMWTDKLDGARFQPESVATGKVKFDKALVVSPETLADITGKIPTPNRPEIGDNSALYVGEDIVKYARANGYDGIVVQGFGDVARSFEAEQAAVEKFGVHESVMQDQVFAFNPEAVALKPKVYKLGEAPTIVEATAEAGIVSAAQEESLDTPDAVIELQGEELVMLASRAPKSEAFKTWFGDSKVVDEGGAPKVFYHGTQSRFAEFKRVEGGNAYGDGYYFTADPAEASDYAVGENVNRITPEGDAGPNVMPVYLKADNPYPARGAITHAQLSALEKAANRKEPGYFKKGELAKTFGSAYPANGDNVLYELPGKGDKNAILRDAGFDALDTPYGMIVFEPTQIKSVNNAGNFDPTDPDILAATSSTRGGYKGEASRPTDGVAGQTDPAADNVNLRQIANNFSKLLGLTVRQGRMTLKGADVMGQYSTGSGVIRLRTPNDLSTLVHEGGHALERNADGPLRQFTKDNEALLKIAARRLYGGDTTKMTNPTLVAEGFAEFFRIYTLNKRFAEVNYSHLDAAFTAMLDQHNTQLRDGLRLIGEQYAAWLQMPSSQLVRNMIVSGKETTGINGAIAEAREQGLGNWFREWVNGVFTGAINRNNDFNGLVSDILNVAEANRNAPLDLKRADDPRVLIRMATNAGNRAMVQLTDGVMPYRSTDPATPGLRAVLLRYHGQKADSNLSAIDPVRQQDFAAYVVALRGIDEFARFSQGLIERPPLAATLGDLNTTVTELETKYGADFQEAAQMLHEYSMGLWEKGYQAGLIDDKTYQDGLSRTFYVPLQRDMSDKEITQSGISASAARQGRSIVKRFRGSDRDVIDPMDALMQKTFALEKVIAENEVKKALAKLADQAGQAGALVERVPAHRLLGEQFSIQEVARQITKDPTLSQTDAQDLLTLLETAIDEGNRIALFRSQQASAAGENVIFFWEKGKLAALQIKDGDVGTDIINTLNAVGTETVPLLVDLIAYPSTFFRAAVTSWPDFLLVNFIRDQMSAFVLTEGYKPFVTGMRGVGDEIRQGDWARQYNAAMGTMGGMNTSTLHSARVNRDIAALRKKGYVARVFGEDGMAGKIKGLARITELTETGTRLGIYRTAFERAKADGLTDWEASVEASYISTDYIDFGLHGNRMMAWRRLVPFLNAQLQGLYKMMRTLGGDEVRQRKGLRFAVAAFFKDTNGLQLSRAERQAVRVGRKAWLKMASLGIIGAAIQAVFEDDPDYQDASEYLRTTGWVIPIGNGEIFYIPKPFELAMVSNIVERGFEHASGDKEAKWRMMRGMAMNLVPPTNPPAIQAVVEQVGNYDYFSGREIVPDYMRALEPELQYNHYTTEFAKSVGDTFGWSPMRIDHALSALGASAYRDLSQMYNMTDPSRPASDRTEWPITRRFVRDARRGAASAQDFWKFASTVDGSLRRAELTYKNYIESGREAAAESYLSDLDPDEQAYAILNTHFKADYKRLNPTYRARQMTTLVSALRRELYSDLGVDNSAPGGELDPFVLSAKEKADVDTLLSEYARREVRNSLVYMKAPGWSNKKPLPTEPTIEMLRATSPMVAEEFERRIKKAKVYDAATIQEYWPEVRDRLLSDRDGAFLKDIQTIAKVMR